MAIFRLLIALTAKSLDTATADSVSSADGGVDVSFRGNCCKQAFTQVSPETSTARLKLA